MTAVEDQPAVPATGPKKRFIGKARAEALRRKAAEQSSGPNIEDGVIATRGPSQIMANAHDRDGTARWKGC